MTTHVQIVPWPLGREGVPTLMTWCGLAVDEDSPPERMEGQRIASSPHAVDCDQCIRAMRMAFGDLHRWLSAPGETSPDVVRLSDRRGAP